jgi:hypothetical protein
VAGGGERQDLEHALSGEQPVELVGHDGAGALLLPESSADIREQLGPLSVS